MGEEMNKRFEQLDSIRGLAAFSVLLHHVALAASIPVITILTTGFSPFRVFTNGQSAVVLFFILSGFVLSLPYLNGSQAKYKVFITKRFFRIYIPYIVSVVLAIFLCFLVSEGGIQEMSDWFNKSWIYPINFHLLLEHIIMIGNFNTDAFNNVIWSLIHEMRISIIFPILGYILIKYKWYSTLGICFGLSLISGLNNIYNFETSYGNNTSFLDTLHYSSMFLIGGLIAKNKDFLLRIYINLSKSLKFILIFLGFISYTYYGGVKAISEKINISPYSEILGDYSIAFGVSLIIIISLGSKNITKYLVIKPFKFLGEISYSLYLYHLIVLTTLVYLLHGIIPIWLIYLLTIIISIIVAKISYNYIEIPAIRIGQKVIFHRYNTNSEKENSKYKAV